MDEEIPIANSPLSAEEKLIVAKLSRADIEAIDATVLANSSEHWLKVARVVGATEKALQHQYPGLSLNFYALRICQLVGDGHLDSRGNLTYMRFSEIRLLPSCPTS